MEKGSFRLCFKGSGRGVLGAVRRKDERRAGSSSAALLPRGRLRKRGRDASISGDSGASQAAGA